MLEKCKNYFYVGIFLVFYHEHVVLHTFVSMQEAYIIGFSDTLFDWRIKRVPVPQLELDVTNYFVP